MHRLPLAPSLVGTVFAILSTASAQTAIFADWGGLTQSSGGNSAVANGTLNSVPFTVSYNGNNTGSTIGNSTTPRPNVSTVGATGYQAFSQSWMNPAAPAGTEYLANAIDMHNSTSEYIDVTINFSSPISNLRMLVNNVDNATMLFSAPDVSLLSGSPDARLAASGPGKMFSDVDSDIASGGTEDNSAAGTLLFNGGNPVSSITFRYLDSANHTNPSDGHHFTFATVIPEPSVTAIAGLGLAGLMLRRRRQA